jgi:hypothetical protein
MDLTILTDEELDALQLAVNVEIGARLKKTRASMRIALAMESATTSGLTNKDIEGVIAEASSLANIPISQPVYVPPPAPPVRSRRTQPQKRRRGGFRPTTISTTPIETQGDVNGEG